MIQSRFLDLFQDALIGLAQYFEAFPGHFADNANCQTGPREGLSFKDKLRYSQMLSDGADLILEQFTERFDQPQFQVLRQPADIMVAFDHRRRPACRRKGFNHIRIERPLGQKRGVLDLFRFFDEHLGEFIPDDLSFFFRVSDLLQPLEKALFGVDDIEVDVKMAVERLLDGSHLVFTQQPVVDKDTMQFRADGFMKQERGDR